MVKYESPMGNLVHDLYTTVVQDLERQYTLLPILTTEFGWVAPAEGIYFYKMNTDKPEVIEQAGWQTPIFQNLGYTTIKIETQFASIEFLINVVDEMKTAIELAANELENIARAIVRYENVKVVEALTAISYGADNAMNVATAGELVFSDLVVARTMLRKNGFGFGNGSMSVLISMDDTGLLLSDEKLINTAYIMSFNNLPNLGSDRQVLAIGGINGIGPVYELPDIPSGTAYLIDVGYAMKSMWRLRPTIKQLYTRGTFDAYESYFDMGVQAVNDKAVIRITI